MSKAVMQQALSAFEAIMFEKDAESCQLIAKNARYALREELAKPEQKPVTNSDLYSTAGRLALELECLLLDTKDISIVSKWWDSAHEALGQWREFHLSFCNTLDSAETFGKPEQPLDKKADNARELGLDYEVEQEFSTKDCPQPELCHGKKCEYCRDMEKAEQEPWLWIRKKYSFEGAWISNRLPDDPENWDAVYKAPPKAWVGLTDDELSKIISSICVYSGDYDVWLSRLVEAKLREKNTLSREPCDWNYDDDGMWQTSCGQSIAYEIDHPENSVKFCQGCGKNAHFVEPVNEGERE